MPLGPFARLLPFLYCPVQPITRSMFIFPGPQTCSICLFPARRHFRVREGGFCGYCGSEGRRVSSNAIVGFFVNMSERLRSDLSSSVRPRMSTVRCDGNSRHPRRLRSPSSPLLCQTTGCVQNSLAYRACIMNQLSCALPKDAYTCSRGTPRGAVISPYPHRRRQPRGIWPGSSSRPCIPPDCADCRRSMHPKKARKSRKTQQRPSGRVRRS